MTDPKPFASLTSGLLARKGAAKPAMRPQGFGQAFGLEDLGWNDMGQGQGQREPAQVRPIREEELPEHVPSSIAALTPAPKNEDAPDADLTSDVMVPPPVVEQQRAIEASFAAPADVVRLSPRPRQERGAKPKAAFTLRLDNERHLKLRLACAVTHRSAQQIVTRALDDYLATLPELDSLANQVPAKLGKRS
jgi:hypothetical protein